VCVDAGDHTIEWTFASDTLLMGLAITITTTALVIAALVKFLVLFKFLGGRKTDSDHSLPDD
ncbi:MAG TPA: hypothetical protein VFI27_16825, partial [candidate division Zixibacteria bacterium]|nr:hypothetical protein [candidate division Zixibacteria bacterium]